MLRPIAVGLAVSLAVLAVWWSAHRLAASYFIARFDAALRAGDTPADAARALPFLARADRATPGDFQVALRAATAELQAGHPSEAGAAAGRALGVEPYSANAWEALARARLAAGDAHGAAAAADRALGILHDYPGALATRALAAARLGDAATADGARARLSALAVTDDDARRLLTILGAPRGNLASVHGAADRDGSRLDRLDAGGRAGSRIALPPLPARAGVHAALRAARRLRHDRRARRAHRLHRSARPTSAARLAGFRLLLPLFPGDRIVAARRVRPGDLQQPRRRQGGDRAARRAARVVRPFADALHLGGGRRVRAARPRRPRSAARRSGAVAHYLRLWDVASTARVDALVANSRYTRAHPALYGRDVRGHRAAGRRRAVRARPRPAASGGRRRAMYLCVSALVPYKRVELAVRAFLGRGAGASAWSSWATGPSARASPAWRGPNIELRGRVDDDELARPLRRLSRGRPPGARRLRHRPRRGAGGRAAGGRLRGAAASLDSVRDGETGVLFAEPTPEALAAALDRLERLAFEPARLRAAAQRFDRTTFERRFGAFVDSSLEAFLESRLSAPRAR